MALTHPSDLRAWQRWQQSRNRLRSTVGRLRSRPPTGVLHTTGPDPEILVCLDSTSPSHRAALLGPLEHLPPGRTAVLAPTRVDLPGGSWTPARWDATSVDRRLDSVRVVLGAGHFLPLGSAGFGLATARGAPYLVVQHGLLTPHAPPLPSGATLLAWSDDDAAYWLSGRADVSTRVVGSELLWRASADAGGDVDVPLDPEGPPTYLGQLHAAELPREQLVEAAESFCRINGATYRPHPSERDRRSRRQHARWESIGIAVDAGGPPLAQLRTPVVSVFSTGVLEAAVRGVPAWVDFPRPPAWLEEFWSRYRMARWAGEHPTPAPEMPAMAPARRVADVVRELT